jgi:hypothetical protein
MVLCCCVPVDAAEEEMPPPAAPWRVTGVGSCTAAGCHGGGHPEQVDGSEYNVWITRDPHARAYSALFNEQSQRMARLLADSGDGQFTAAQEDPRCLACHSMVDAPAREPLVNVVSDGVGCESCHGPAEGWLAEHYPKGALSAARRRELGFWDTDRLLTRTQICVRCHVGGPGRDVNHDLIAAGHPRLEFEMGAYLAAVPKHWDDADDEDLVRAGANFDALVWAFGQACTSQAAVTQLANRADGKGVRNLFVQAGAAKRSAADEKVPDTFSPWPEFAEWSCAACHHDLRDDLGRQERLAEVDNLSGRRITWDTWNHYTTRRYAAEVSRAFGVDTNEAAGIGANLRALDALMRQINPDRRQVAEQARNTSQRLGQWAASLEQASLDRSRLDGLTRAMLGGQADSPLTDWSAAAQLYDALASLHETRLRFATQGSGARVASDQEITRAIRALYGELAARERSPQDYQFQPERVRARLIELQRLLPAAGGGR